MKLLFLALVFSRVLALCDGRPADVDGYSFQVAYKDPTFYPCRMLVCEPECIEVEDVCVIYGFTGWTEGHYEPDPGVGEEVRVEEDAWNLPTPPRLGAVAYLDVRTVMSGKIWGDCP